MGLAAFCMLDNVTIGQVETEETESWNGKLKRKAETENWNGKG